jgi:hypothetical protein
MREDIAVQLVTMVVWGIYDSGGSRERRNKKQKNKLGKKTIN